MRQIQLTMFKTEQVETGYFPKQNKTKQNKNDLIENKRSLGKLNTANIDWGEIRHSRNNE